MTRTLRDIRGDLLSCYTTSVAGYLAAVGVDPNAVLAPQWHVGVRGDGTPESLEIQHFHTSLLGDGRCYRVELRPRRAPSAVEAHRALADEVERVGAAIAMADTELLPWLVTHGRSSAPHWLLIDAVRADGALHVVDRFEWTDDSGEQYAREVWLPADDVRVLAYRPHLEGDRRYRLRERWAFGEPLALGPAPSTGEAPSWRWFERIAYSAGGETPSAFAERMLTRSLLPASAALGAELTGAAAIMRIADVLEDALDAAEAYDLSNDLWVIGRTREMFAAWLGQHDGKAEERYAPLREALADIASTWSVVARFMHYNAAAIARGRPPRSTVVDVLRELAIREDGLAAERMLAAGAQPGPATLAIDCTGGRSFLGIR